MKGDDIDLFALTGEKKRARGTIDRFRGRIDRRVAPIILSTSEFVEFRSKDKPLHDRILGEIVLWQAGNSSDPEAACGAKTGKN